MGRWKRPDIVPQGDENCVAHTLSVMRLALGYKTGVPEGYELTDRCLTHGESLAAAEDFFPDRHVIFAFTNASVLFCSLLKDDYLFAFSYAQAMEHDGEHVGHVVIGVPLVLDDMVVNWILAVSIERKWK